MSAQAPSYFGRDLEAMSFARNYHRWILDAFRSHLGGDLAEIGAGSGNFSEMLLSEPQVRSLVSFEPSSNMFPHLVRTLSPHGARARAVPGYLSEHSEGLRSSFDTVLYVNVLEHVPDQARELAHASALLRPGGSLLVFVPACPFLMSDFDRSIGHFRRYRERDLREVVGNAGFRIEECRYFDLLGILPWYVVFVLMKRTLSGGNVSTYDRFVVPWLRRLEAMVAPPIGKNLLLIARKS